jgi:predicted nucleotidyltransferase
MLTIGEIKEKVEPIAKKHGVPRIYLFGSFARGAATPDSDIDFAIQKEGSKIRSLFDMGALYDDFEREFGEVDIITLESLSESGTNSVFAENAREGMVLIYG